MNKKELFIGLSIIWIFSIIGCEKKQSDIVLESTNDITLSIPTSLEFQNVKIGQVHVDLLLEDILEGDKRGLSVWSKNKYFSNENIEFKHLRNESDRNLFEGNISYPEASNETNYFKVVYPKITETSNSASSVTLKLSGQQVQRGNLAQLNQKGYFIGEAETSNVESEVNVQMSFPWPVLKFNISTDGLPNNISIQKAIKLTLNSSKDFIGNFVYDLNSEKVVQAGKGKNLNLIFEDEPLLSTNIKAYGVLRPSDLRESGTSVVIETNEGFFYIPIEPESDFVGNKVYDIDLNLGDLLAEGKAKFNYFPKDLSEDETANSYIVTKEGAYSFKTTKGNSKDMPEGIVSANWLWTTKEDLVSEVSYQAGRILFETSGKEGNAVLAGFDETGDIVWSWHIWMTEDPRVNLHKVQNYYLMDRNLGATSNSYGDIKSYGLYYQWGRKDPFVGAKAKGVKSTAINTTPLENSAFTNNVTQDYVVNPLYSSQFFKVLSNNDSQIKSGESIEFSIANPMTFIGYSDKTASSAEGDWLNTVQQEDLWGRRSGTTVSQFKSIYDPCPAGFRVAHGGNITFWTADPATPSSPRMLTQDANVEFKSDTRGFVYNYEGKPYFYPAAGYRNSEGKLTGVDNEMWIWSSMVTLHGARVFRIHPFTRGGNYYDHYTNPTERGYRSQGNTCRCVLED